MNSQITGRNMLIISKVDKSRSLSIEFDTNQLTSIGIDNSRFHNFLWFLTLIDFNRQVSGIQKTMHARRGDDREPTHLFECELCLIIFKGRIKHTYCFLESFVEPRKLSCNVEMVRCFIFFFGILNIQSRRFDRYTMLRCLTLVCACKSTTSWKPCDYRLLSTNLTCRLTSIDKYRVLPTYRLRFPWSTLIDMLRPANDYHNVKTEQSIPT